MQRLMGGIVIFLVLLTGSALAVEIPLADGLAMDLVLADGWTAQREAPAALVAEIAEHLEHEALAQGQRPTPEQLLAAARKRLAANEAFVVHGSGAHLDCDASPLDAGALPPSGGTLRLSAEYASESLRGEEGVSDYRAQINTVPLAGVPQAVRLEAEYRHHGEAVKFVGLITFAAGHWLFFYYTDPLADPQAYPAMEAMLAGLRVRATSP